MTDQELADAIQAAIAEAIKIGTEGVRRACNAAATVPEAEGVVPPISATVGHLWLAHGESTKAANAMPTVAPNFGGK